MLYWYDNSLKIVLYLWNAFFHGKQLIDPPPSQRKMRQNLEYDVTSTSIFNVVKNVCINGNPKLVHV